MYKAHNEILSCLELVAHKTAEEKLDGYTLRHIYDKCDNLMTNVQEACIHPLAMTSIDSLMSAMGFHKKLFKQIEDSQNYVNDGSTSKLLENNYTPNHKNSSHNFDQIFGAEDAKMYLREACIMPLQLPHLFTGKLKPWSRILLYGPPGTGKTMLANALSTEMNYKFFTVSSADLLSVWVGESEKHVQDLFRAANEYPQKCVIFIDEIDSLCRERSQTEDEHSRRVKTELLCQLDDILQKDNKCLVLAATNCPWDLDRAFLRRFQRRIFVDLPDKTTRRKILGNMFNVDQIQLGEDDWMKIIEMTEGYSGADLTHLSMAVTYIPMRELHTAQFWKVTKGHIIPCGMNDTEAMKYTIDQLLPSDKVKPRSIELQDFMAALQSTPKSINKEIMDKYREFSNQ